jgi:glycosyltransferase involved in cell wall biosynthesis
VKIGILTSLFYHETSEIQGKDRIIFGGAERYLLELCNLLQSEGHNVTVYQSLNQIAEREDHTVRIKSGNIGKNFRGIPVVCLADTDHNWEYSTNQKLNTIFNEVGIHMDLLIFFAPFLVWPYAPVNSISICHGIYWDYHSHFVATEGEWQKKEWMKRNLYGFTAPSACVAVDSNVRKSISAIEPGAERRIFTVHNFVDTAKFTHAERTWEEIRVLYPRRLTNLRGCNEFIKASLNYKDYQYIAVGQSAGKQLEDDVTSWGHTTKNIRFTHKEMDGMEEVYQSADIAVIPTRGAEGLALSLLEAMSCGLPVITTNSGGLGDAVIPDYNALVYDYNHDDLGRLVDYLAKNEEIREIFGKRNRQIAVESFDIRLWQEKWKNLLRGMGC